MKTSHILGAAICSGAILLVTAPTQALAQAQAQSPAARQPIKTPLGRVPAEVLASKVVVSDMAKSFEFYTKVVGLRPAKTLSQAEPPPPPPGPDSSKWPSEYGLNFSGSFADTFFDLLRPHADAKPTPASANLVTLVFKVPDAQAVMRRAREVGYQVITEAPVVGPGEMSIGFIRDPDGYRVEIIQAADYPKGR